MEPATLAELRAALPAWVGLGGLAWIPVAAVISFVASQLAMSLALLSYRGVPADAHWTERARRSWPARIVGPASQWVLALCLAMIALRDSGPLAVVDPAVVAVAAGIAAFVAARPASRRGVRRIGLPVVPFARAMRGVASSLLVVMPHLPVVLLAAALMPSALEAAVAVSIVVLALHAALAMGLGFRAAAVLGLIRPADARLTAIVEACSDRVGVRAKRVWVARLEMLNAYAFPRTGELLFTERAVNELSDDELTAITAHELGHLGESPRVVLVRSLGFLALVPLMWIRPLVSGDTAGLRNVALLLLSVVILLLVVRRVARRMEERADAIGHAHEGDPGAYARALERIYELNLLPAVTAAKRSVHPHLYDRLVASGVTPSYPRPAPPPRGTQRIAILALCAAVIGGWLGWRTALDGAASPPDEEPPLWLVALRGGDRSDLEALGRARWDRGDLEAALPFYRGLMELEPDDAYWPAANALLEASLTRCDHAADLALRARSLLPEPELDPARGGVLSDAITAVEACFERTGGEP